MRKKIQSDVGTLTICQAQLSACGQAGRNPVRLFGNNKETALWFARQLGAVIGSYQLSERDRESAVKDTYEQYVIATHMKPVIAAETFLAEVCRVLSIPSHIIYLQPEIIKSSKDFL